MVLVLQREERVTECFINNILLFSSLLFVFDLDSGGSDYPDADDHGKEEEK